MRRQKATTMEKPIEEGNGLDIASYKSRFMSDLELNPAFDIAGSKLRVDLESAASLSKEDRQACFELIERTSSHDYAASSMGWHPRQKLKEMRLPDLRYLLVRPITKDAATTNAPHGFVSFMLTYEDGKEVIYVYEIHLAAELRGSGLGQRLMRMVETAGARAGMKKCMLTVFASNGPARRFYGRLGYDVDEFSPEPRTLRNGVVKEPDYVILSKGLHLDERNDQT